MKLVRVWFLVLLAALLPVRGAMSAAMVCLPPISGSQGETGTGPSRLVSTTSALAAATAVHEPGSHHGHATTPAGDLHAFHGAGPAHGEGGQGHQGCDLCSAGCSVTPLPSAAPDVPPPLPLAAAIFPAIRAPGASFFADAQDRPPRSF